MGLTYAADLHAWQRWQDSRAPARAALGRLRSRAPRAVLALGGPEPDILVALDSGSPSSRASLLAPLEHLPQERVAVLGPPGVAPTSAGWHASQWVSDRVDRRLDTIRVVLAGGHYLPLGAAGFGLACGLGVPYLVAQHGALTPHAPPLPTGAIVLAWSRDDGDFWRSGRNDITVQVVGPQLLWQAAVTPEVVGAGGARRRRQADSIPTYLGQLHGAELPREQLVQAAESFCLAYNATYRPHPAETDRRSRRQHERWEDLGIVIDTDGTPLAHLHTPVVSVFSTGVLEAAARGLPAFVDLPDPPDWVLDLWRRYDMRPWGGEPTPAFPLPDVEPAARTAAFVLALL